MLAFVAAKAAALGGDVDRMRQAERRFEDDVLALLASRLPAASRSMGRKLRIVAAVALPLGVAYAVFPRQMAAVSLQLIGILLAAAAVYLLVVAARLERKAAERARKVEEMRLTRPGSLADLLAQRMRGSMKR